MLYFKRRGLGTRGANPKKPPSLVHLVAAEGPPLKRRAMVELRKYRDGLEDEVDMSEFPSLSLSRMQMFQLRRFFNVFCVFCVASYNDEHLVCSPDIHLRHSVDGGRPLSSSGSSEERGDSKIFVLSEQQPLAPLVLVLWLDSGATHHAVGDARILCNLRDPPAGTAVRAADGVRLLVHKIGDIQTQYIKIEDVYLVLGLQENLISVRQLAKDNKIVTIFYENYAELWREGKQVGGAIADNVTSLYRLRYLMPPTADPEAGTSRYIREDTMDMATARGATSRSSFLQFLSLSAWTSTETESKMIAWDMQQQQELCPKQRDNVFQCRTCGCCLFQALGGHRTSHTRQHRVHANDLDLLGARSGKGAAQIVHRSYFTGEVFPAVQALSRHRAAFHVADGDSRWPFSIGDYRWALADYSETSLADGER